MHFIVLVFIDLAFSQLSNAGTGKKRKEIRTPCPELCIRKRIKYCPCPVSRACDALCIMLNDWNNFSSIFCISDWFSWNPAQHGDPVVQVIFQPILKIHDRWRADLESLGVLLVVPHLKDADLEIWRRNDGDRDVSVIVISIFDSMLGYQAICKRYLAGVKATNTARLWVSYESADMGLRFVLPACEAYEPPLPLGRICGANFVAT